jgi:superfamily II DNA/RNA helicase
VRRVHRLAGPAASGSGSDAPDRATDVDPELLDVTVAPARLPDPATPDTTSDTTSDTAVPSVPAFAALGVPAKLVAVLARQGITEPTPVQALVIPDALAGRDVLGRARTGTGKTLAFGLPLLARLVGGRRAPHAPRALIVLPTRELANQVRAALEPLAHSLELKVVTVYGGVPYDRQVKRLRQGVDLVIATPGRLGDLIRRGACRLDAIEAVVLDEADHLCDLGFYPVVDGLLAQTPGGGQRMLLSATLDGDVDRLVRTHLSDAVRHDLHPGADAPVHMDHHVLVTSHTTRPATAAALLRANPRSMVFTRTRDGATELARSLTEAGVPAVDLHGNLSQRLRERNLRQFSSGRADVVVATDVAARGIHVDGVDLVVHYDVPDEAKSFLHRSGRTARAGRAGTVVTMTTPRMVDRVVTMQKAAGVRARHHDERTAPSPMTVEALSESGTSAPAVSGRRSPSGSGSGSRPYRRTGGGQPGRSGGRPSGSGGRPRTSRAQRWS